MAKSNKSVKASRTVADIFCHILLAVMCIIWILPFVYLLAQSFRGGVNRGMYSTTFFPREWTFDNYIRLFTETQTLDFKRMFLNTLFISTCACCISTFIVLNCMYQFGSRRETDLLKICAHPGYECGSKEAFISAFNMTTEESVRLYGAFIAFLAMYYTPEENPFHLGGVVIGNEITVPRFWGNAGVMAIEDYMEEYFHAMRIAWICGKKYFQRFPKREVKGDIPWAITDMSDAMKMPFQSSFHMPKQRQRRPVVPTESPAGSFLSHNVPA